MGKIEAMGWRFRRAKLKQHALLFADAMFGETLRRVVLAVDTNTGLVRLFRVVLVQGELNDDGTYEVQGQVAVCRMEQDDMAWHPASIPLLAEFSLNGYPVMLDGLADNAPKLEDLPLEGDSTVEPEDDMPDYLRDAIIELFDDEDDEDVSD